VLNAYNGNVPAALDLTLGEAFADPLRFLPAGPESADDELDTEMALYDLPAAEASRIFRLEQVPRALPDPLRHVRFDLNRLDALEIDQIIELREAAAPDELFRLRHRSLGSAVLLEGHVQQLIDASADYVDRLMTMGNVLTKSAERGAFTTILGDRHGPGHEFADYYLRSADQSLLADQLVMCISDVPAVSPQIAMCDLEKLTQFCPEFDEVIERVGGVTVLLISRPDYRIIKTFGEELSTPKPGGDLQD
jgi:hypothetical protein